MSSKCLDQYALHQQSLQSWRKQRSKWTIQWIDLFHCTHIFSKVHGRNLVPGSGHATVLAQSTLRLSALEMESRGFNFTYLGYFGIVGVQLRHSRNLQPAAHSNAHKTVTRTFVCCTLMVILLSTPLRESLNTLGEFFNIYYFKPYTRAPPYLVGMFLGWILHQSKKRNFQFPLSRTARKVLCWKCQ